MLAVFKTYCFSGVAHFANGAVLDHVVAKETCCEIVVRPDDAREARNAGDCEKQVLDNFLSVEGHYLN